MKKRILLLIAAMLSALLLTGCARTIDELYSPPKRSEEYSRLQSAIDIAMAGLSYSAPLTGENQQAVQMADLDGDGRDEYLVFAKGNSDKPMQILIFRQDEEGNVEISEIIGNHGSAFELVQYEEIDGKPGQELVVGRQVSDMLMGSAAVYSFSSGRAEKLMSAGYSRLLTVDMGGSEQKELLLIQRGESDQANAIAVLYRYRNKSMVRSVEVELSRPAYSVKRIACGQLEGGGSAVYVSSSTAESAIRTDILTLNGERLVKIDVLDPLEDVVQTVSNYYVYAEDVDEDGVVEIPSPIPVRPISDTWSREEQNLIRWYSVDHSGVQTNKLYSFHNYADGWYLELDEQLVRRFTVKQVGSTFAFYLWDEAFQEASQVFTVYALSGSDRQTQAEMDSRFVLMKMADVIYAARLEGNQTINGIDKDYLTESFHLIHQEWKSGEM